MNLRAVFLAVFGALLLSGCSSTLIPPKGPLRQVTVLSETSEAPSDAIQIIEVRDEMRFPDAFFYTIKIKYSLKNRDDALVDVAANIANLDIYGVQARQKVVRGSGELETEMGIQLSDSSRVKSYQIGVFLRARPDGRILAKDYRSILFKQTRKKNEPR